LLPSRDLLRDRFAEEFGKTGKFSVSRLANSICTRRE
jgi:hypothetical protein